MLVPCYSGAGHPDDGGVGPEPRPPPGAAAVRPVQPGAAFRGVLRARGGSVLRAVPRPAAPAAGRRAAAAEPAERADQHPLLPRLLPSALGGSSAQQRKSTTMTASAFKAAGPLVAKCCCHVLSVDLHESALWDRKSPSTLNFQDSCLFAHLFVLFTC